MNEVYEYGIEFCKHEQKNWFSLCLFEYEKIKYWLFFDGNFSMSLLSAV